MCILKWPVPSSTPAPDTHALTTPKVTPKVNALTIVPPLPGQTTCSMLAPRSMSQPFIRSTLALSVTALALSVLNKTLFPLQALHLCAKTYPRTIKSCAWFNCSSSSSSFTNHRPSQWIVKRDNGGRKKIISEIKRERYKCGHVNSAC